MSNHSNLHVDCRNADHEGPRQENEKFREALQAWLTWYADAEAHGGPRKLTQDLLDNNYPPLPEIKPITTVLKKL